MPLPQFEQNVELDAALMAAAKQAEDVTDLKAFRAVAESYGLDSQQTAARAMWLFLTQSSDYLDKVRERAAAIMEATPPKGAPLN